MGEIWVGGREQKSEGGQQISVGAQRRSRDEGRNINRRRAEERGRRAIQKRRPEECTSEMKRRSGR